MSNIPKAVPGLAGCRVLLVDDGPASRLLYEVALARAGADVLSAPDPPTARRLFLEELADGRDFGLAVLDYNTPGQDGVDLAAALRADGFNGAIAGLTAGVSDTDARRWRGAGCDAVFPKALSLPALVSRLAALARRSPR